MARNTLLRHQNSNYQHSDFSSEMRGLEKSENLTNFTDAKGNMKLSLKQLVIFWSGSLSFILLAFYLGFNAGKRSGAIAVLDEAGDQMVRLDLHTPVEPYPAVEERLPETNFRNEPTLKKTNPAEDKKANNTSSKAVESEPSKIDFTTTAPLDSGRKLDLSKIENLKKSTNEPKLEEIYPGKNLFAPLPPKTSNAEKDLIAKKEELQVEQALEKTKPKKVEAPSAKSLVPQNGWYVQVAAAPTEEEGLRFYQKMTAKGLKLSLEPASIKDKSFFRVLIGPYTNKAMAMEKRNEVRQQAGTSNEPFIREVR